LEEVAAQFGLTNTGASEHLIELVMQEERKDIGGGFYIPTVLFKDEEPIVEYLRSQPPGTAIAIGELDAKLNLACRARRTLVHLASVGVVEVDYDQNTVSLKTEEPQKP
jgi:hypothetical protein